MKEVFDVKLRLNHANKARLKIINDIIAEYLADGYKLTLRQLYYQLVSRDIIPNKQSEYAKVGNLLKKGRMAGVIDWDAIEDRLRRPQIPYWVHGVEDALKDTIRQYRLNRLDDQDVYIEVWSEKDALSGILYRVTSKYQVNLVINRGYGSITAIYDAYKRFKTQIAAGKTTHLLYFGDHDASGLDMVRDIKDRMLQFFMSGLLSVLRDREFKTNDEKVEWYGNYLAKVFTVEHVGLTTDQVGEFNPPPNPAKESDPRFKWYQREYGNSSWEVDALEPAVLTDLLSTAIEDQIDLGMYESVLRQETIDKLDLDKIKDDYENR